MPRFTARLLGVATTIVVVATGTLAAAAPANATVLTKPPKVQTERSVPGTDFVPTSKKSRPGARESSKNYQLHGHLPKPTSQLSIKLPTTKGAWGRTSGAPVSLGAATRHGSIQANLTSASVQILSADAARKAGVHGVLLRVTKPVASLSAGTTAAAPADDAMPVDVPISVNYSTFKDAFGGDWASRLQLTEIPDCALTSASGCGSSKPLKTKNDSTSRTLTATVPMTQNSMLVAAAATASSDQGDFSATPFAASSEWSVGLQTGDFSWSYPIPTVPVPSGLVPDVSISYDAQSVDGRTQAANNQTSWLGEGQGLESGFIERSYASCSDQQTSTQTGDLCWKSDNATLSFQGQGSQLVHIAGTNEWRAKKDQGWRILRLNDTSPGNGDNDGEYWQVTDQDGTRYYFGKEHRYTADTDSTDSTWTVPVFGNNTGEPCHDTTFASSWCQQAWRWNLDYVVDTHGNTMTYKYSAETNHYGLNNNAAQPTYDRGGYLREIDYGQIAGTELTAPGAARVLFDVSERCLPDANFDCDPSKLTSTNASHWPDVPFDKICTDQTSCQDSKSPTFFSRKRLTDIRTQVRSGGTYADVDSFAMSQSFPVSGDGTGRSLFLDSITRTGHSGSSSLSTPAVTFHGVQLPNRVLLDGAAPLLKWRVDQITTESGGNIIVNYNGADCQPGNMPANPESNTRLCFPVYWQQNIYSPPSLNWFNKYTVASIVESDAHATVVPVKTSYTYSKGAAWHYDDNELVKPKYRTWGQFRGFNTVEVTKGDPSEAGTVQSYDKYLYFQGMNGDRLPDGPDPDANPDSRIAKITDSQSLAVMNDDDYLAGFQREHIQRNGPTGEVVSAEIDDPWHSPTPTADDGTDQAQILRTAAVHTRKQLVGTSNYTRSTMTTSYDSYGLPTSVEDAGDDSKTTDSTCTTTDYARDVSQWLLTTIKETKVVGVACNATPAATDVLSDKRYSFDSGAFGATPSKGDVTKEETLSGTAGSSSWKTTSQMGYDARGRVTSTTDGLGNTSGVTYTPSGADSNNLGPVTQQVTYNAKSQQTTTTFDPSRGAPLTVTDPNGRVQSATYDALGRVTAVWQPGHVQGVDNPDTKYSYGLSNSTYSYLATSRLLNDGTYDTSYDIYDAMLRPVETQASSTQLSTDRAITTTEYNSLGQASFKLGPYLNSGTTPTGTYFAPSTVNVYNQHRYLYDGAGRQTADIYQPKGAEAWRTTTVYDADRTKVTPPSGGTPTEDIIDVRGNTLTHIDHLGTTTAAPGQNTTYTYDLASRMKSMTDPKGDVWTWAYDLRGNQIAVKDPDKGNASMSYDNNDQLATTTDARGISTLATYDALGRKVALYDGTTVDPTKLRASWLYDTLAAGQLTSSTRYATPGNSTTAYVNAVTGYNTRYEPTGTSVTVPSITGQTDTLAGTYSTSMTYNDDGTLKTKTLPSVTGLGAETVSYFYDKLGLLRTMGGRDSYVGASTYSPFGELLQLSLGTTSGKLAFQTWYLDEGTRRLTRNVVSNQAVTGSLLDANYTYDNDGNVKALADNGGTTDIQCFNYDYQRQLKESWTINTGTCGTTPSQTVMGTNTGAYWASYTYDTVGNRLTRTDHVKTGTSNTVYTYTPGPSGASVVPNGATGVGGPHSVASVSKKVGTGTATTTSYKYDSSGNMSLRGAETDTWDSEGKLATTKTGTAAAATNIYDADGNRILRRDPSGTTTLYLDSSEVKLAGTTKTSQRWYGFGSKIVATRTASALYLIAANDQGTASVQMDVATAAYVKRRFNPFGDARASTVSTGATWNGDHGFLDKPVDASGLTQVGARYYDASLGRFISVDPVLDSNDAIQANAYAYGANNPVTSSDPTGLRAWCGDTECTTPLPRPSGTGGDQSKGPPSPPAVDRSPSDSSRTSRAFDLVRSIAIAIWNPVSPGLTQFHEFAGDPLHNLAERLDTEGRHRAPTRFNQYQAERAKEAYRLRTGMLPTHRLGGPTAWRTNYRLWDKIGRIVESKPAKVLGFLGTVAAVTHDYGEHRSDGDSRTASVIKVGIETAISAAGAETLAPAGVLCGPAVEVCSPLLAGVGAWGGHELGGLVTDTFSSQINWTAGKLDDAGSAVADSKYAPWNW